MYRNRPARILRINRPFELICGPYEVLDGTIIGAGSQGTQMFLLNNFGSEQNKDLEPSAFDSAELETSES